MWRAGGPVRASVPALESTRPSPVDRLENDMSKPKALAGLAALLAFSFAPIGPVAAGVAVAVLRSAARLAGAESFAGRGGERPRAGPGPDARGSAGLGQGPGRDELQARSPCTSTWSPTAPSAA